MSNQFSLARMVWRYLLVCLPAIFTPSAVVADLIKLDTEVGFESVYLLKDPNATSVTVAVTILAGEVDFAGPEGLSHYLEHLMFWHADNAGGQPLHARGGNAWVNGIVTSYYNESEKRDLNDMLEFAARLFDPPNLDKGFMLRERLVVAREYDLRVSESPDRRIRTKIRKDLYNNLAVSRSVIGTPTSIHSLTLPQAFQFHSRFYHPANSVLFIAGNLDKPEAENAINNHFADIEPGSPHKAVWRDATIAETSDNVTVFTDPQVNHERLMYLTLSQWPGGNTALQNRYSLWLLQRVLDSALEGGVARPLRMDNFVLRSFDMGFNSYLTNYFEFLFYAEPDRGVSLTQATTAIGETIQSLAAARVPEETLERVRSRLVQTETRHRNSTESNYYRMSEELSSGLSPVTFSEHLEYIKQVRLEDVNALLRALANPKRRSIAHITPVAHESPKED